MHNHEKLDRIEEESFGSSAPHCNESGDTPYIHLIHVCGSDSSAGVHNHSDSMLKGCNEEETTERAKYYDKHDDEGLLSRRYKKRLFTCLNAGMSSSMDT